MEMTPGLNLESCPNQLSKFGYHQTPDRLLTDSQQTFDRLTLNLATEIGELLESALQIWLPSDSWPTADWLMTDSWLTPDWLRTDSGLTPNILWTDSYWTAEICLRWHQVSIWRAVQISSPNLESFPNQLSKFSYHHAHDRLLTDSWPTSDWLPTDF